MVVEITQIGIQTLKWKFYIIWTVLNGSFVPFTYFLYPETAGRTLEDIDHYFRKQPGLLVFRDKVRIGVSIHAMCLLTIGRSWLLNPHVLRSSSTRRNRRFVAEAQSILEPPVWLRHIAVTVSCSNLAVVERAFRRPNHRLKTIIRKRSRLLTRSVRRPLDMRCPSLSVWSQDLSLSGEALLYLETPNV